uniref:(northern house mosquito) hypothetical protein n=1 Tax=Culex pipiens TaxID=7175 RepID=A0A8D8IU97_CULPI
MTAARGSFYGLMSRTLLGGRTSAALIHHKHMHSSSSSSVQLCVTDGRSSRTDKALPGFLFYLFSFCFAFDRKCKMRFEVFRILTGAKPRSDDLGSCGPSFLHLNSQSISDFFPFSQHLPCH